MSNFDMLKVNPSLVYCPDDEAYILTSNTNLSHSFNYSRQSLIGYSLASWAENIDSLNKTATFSGAILVQNPDSAYSRIGYMNTVDEKVFYDLYRWFINTSVINIYNVENIKFDIGKMSTMTINLKSHSPDTTVVYENEEVDYFYILPEFEIHKTDNIYHINSDETLPARTLNNFDLYVCKNDGTPITDVYVSKINSDLKLSWSELKTIQTEFYSDEEPTFITVNDVDFTYSGATPAADLYQNSPNMPSLTQDNIPFTNMHMLTNIENTIDIELYVATNLLGRNAERWVADYWQDKDPIYICLKNSTPAFVPLIKMIDPFLSSPKVLKRFSTSNIIWRINSINVNATGGELSKLDIKTTANYRIIPDTEDDPTPDPQETDLPLT
jgi:hypothetical protein